MGIKAVKDFLVGALVGVMSMMPGASGGIIAVIFGIYERLIADVASIRRRLLKDLGFIIPVGLGMVVGLVACAVAISALSDDWEIPLMFLFAALIVFQIPDINRLCMSGGEGRPSAMNILACVVGVAVMVSFILMGNTSSDVSLLELDPVDYVLLFVIGAVVALSKVVPGLSGAAILMAIGLYFPLMGLFGLDDGVSLSVVMDRAPALIPLALGVVVGAVGFAKIVAYLLERYRRSTYYCILGITIGSVVTVVVDACRGYDGSTEMAVACVAFAVVGIVFGYLLSRVSAKYAQETIEGEPGNA